MFSQSGQFLFVFSLTNRAELSDPTIARMNRVNLGANLISAFLYILMGLFGYILYLDINVKTGGNIINALPEDVFSSVPVSWLFSFWRSDSSRAVYDRYPLPLSRFAFRNAKLNRANFLFKLCFQLVPSLPSICLFSLQVSSHVSDDHYHGMHHDVRHLCP